jgi:hypothetical protein
MRELSTHSRRFARIRGSTSPFPRRGGANTPERRSCAKQKTPQPRGRDCLKAVRQTGSVRPIVVSIVVPIFVRFIVVSIVIPIFVDNDRDKDRDEDGKDDDRDKDRDEDGKDNDRDKDRDEDGEREAGAILSRSFASFVVPKTLPRLPRHRRGLERLQRSTP